MKVKNKLTKETLEIPYPEFRIKFAKEIQAAFESYKQTELSKPYFKINNSIEKDFYFNLQRNFNHFCISNYYIEQYN